MVCHFQMAQQKMCLCTFVSVCECGQGRERQKPSVANCEQSHLCEGYGGIHCMTLNYSTALKIFKIKSTYIYVSAYTSVLRIYVYIYTTESINLREVEYLCNYSKGTKSNLEQNRYSFKDWESPPHSSQRGQTNPKKPCHSKELSRRRQDVDLFISYPTGTGDGQSSVKEKGSKCSKCNVI